MKLLSLFMITLFAGVQTAAACNTASCFTPRTAAGLGYPSLIQGCEGPYGDACCPQGWNFHAYFSPGRCPSGYRGCTLPTTTQRAETTNICCPNGFECVGQDYCVKSFNTRSTMTYIDSTLSTQRVVYGVTASPVQIRFKAAESTIVPVPTDSLKLPKERHPLDKRAKAGIGIGVVAGVVLLGACVFFAVRYYRRGKVSGSGFRPVIDASGVSSEDCDRRRAEHGDGGIWTRRLRIPVL
ncbi:hypothetical protein N7512_002352 [Penicillium capsulatum]|nr:hypothetical protein N7512_002352 [Penicillium capsulatum]